MIEDPLSLRFLPVCFYALPQIFFGSFLPDLLLGSINLIILLKNTRNIKNIIRIAPHLVDINHFVQFSGRIPPVIIRPKINKKNKDNPTTFLKKLFLLFDSDIFCKKLYLPISNLF
ncbi:MAG: hypothetical protein GY699_14260 [Desulfobacteraceae bacterium]|nr:hypothetical protein [Desulfobacteraceae bacterium]